MRLGALLLVVGLTGVFACSSILGVEDVRPKGFTPRPGTDAGSDDDDGDSLTGRDGGRDPDEDGSEEPNGAQECNGVLACERLVFVTSEGFTGKLGGLSGADQKCFEAAKKIGAPYTGRAFRAWLSDSTTNASDRLPRGTKPYRRTDNKVLATSFTDLTDGTIALPFLDQKGVALKIADGSNVWTGSSPDGKNNTFNCDDWTSDVVQASGGIGEGTATNEEWTEIPGDPGEPVVTSCNAEHHLYCVEY